MEIIKEEGGDIGKSPLPLFIMKRII